jgi:hypothetical protein
MGSAIGRRPGPRQPVGDSHTRRKADPDHLAARKLYYEAYRVGLDWLATTRNRRLYFHRASVPFEVWAVQIDRSGVHWFDAEIIKITDRNVMVRYAGETARLDRNRLVVWWAYWRGVRFVSSRTGRIAAALDQVWWKRYGTAGGTPPTMQMPLQQARLLPRFPVSHALPNPALGSRSSN